MEVAPAAQSAVSELEADPARPVKLLLVGGVGTGKSTALATVRDVLRGAGVRLLTRPPRPGDPPAAVVVDDAHLLSDAQLRTLTDLAADPGATVVVTAEPREQDPALRALATTIEREHPRITLGAWSRAEVGHRLTIGDSSTLDALMAATSGLPFLVYAGGNAARSADGIARAATAALAERLRRLDESVLSTLLVMSLSPGLGSSDVAAALGADAEAASALVDQAYATGLLDPAHGAPFTSSLHDTLASLAGAARHREIEAALLHSQVELSSLSTDLALTLAEHGLRDEQLAGFLDQSATDDRRPGETARILRAALTAGAGGAALETRLADALALSGDCASAAARADALLEADDPDQRAAAVRIAASVAVHDGGTGQAAELFGWLASGVAPPTDAMVGAAGAIVLVAAGEATAARALSTDRGGPPTASTRTARRLAEGVLLTLDQPYAVAAARLGQAIGTDRREAEAMPDSAPALVTLAAMHAGDTVRARGVIMRAVGNDDSAVLFSHRHRLLQAWVRMQDGQLGSAATDVSAAGAVSDLHRRDALWAAALQTGIARRTGDSGALEKHWFAGMDVLAEYSIDLFSLLPLGELWVAAARLRRADRLDHALDQAFGLLRALGDPPAWSLPLHWAGVHAAILANSPEAMAPHGQALAAAAESSDFAATLAAAGRAWLRVLARQVDVDGVAAAARGLAQFGLTWDATRLAGEAALQATDPRISGAMLQIARDLKLATDVPEVHDAPVNSADGRIAGSPIPGRSPLSEREREVAELLLLGMPYRDIGTQLFISAKTVEHHVARIRRRLGAESRSEMLSMLRVILLPQA